MNARRNVLIFLGAAALARTLPSFAQQPALPRIGILSLGVARDNNGAAFVEGMRDLGYVEGKNILYEWRFGAFDSARIAAAARELAQLNVAVILSVEGGVGSAMKAASNIPIVMFAAGDPVGSGYAASLAKPGGNVTGLSSQTAEIAPKQLELLRIVLPKLSRVAILLTPSNTIRKPILQSLRGAAKKMGVQVFVVDAASVADIAPAFSEMKRHRVEALIVPRATLFGSNGSRVTELAAKARLPTIYTGMEFAGDDGLMSYSAPLAESYRRAAVYVDKILKGAKPADLPIEQPTKYELVVNMKAAKAMGLAIPQSVLLRADRVIE